MGGELDHLKLSQLVMPFGVKTDGALKSLEKVGLEVFSFSSSLGSFPQCTEKAALPAEKGEDALVFSPGRTSEDGAGLVDDPRQVSVGEAKEMDVFLAFL